MSSNSILISTAVIAQSGIVFGISCSRRLVTQFTSNVCGAFTVAFFTGLKQSFTFKTVAIAIDNRSSNYAMAQA